MLAFEEQRFWYKYCCKRALFDCMCLLCKHKITQEFSGGIKKAWLNI